VDRSASGASSGSLNRCTGHFGSPEEGDHAWTGVLRACRRGCTPLDRGTSGASIGSLNRCTGHCELTRGGGAIHSKTLTITTQHHSKEVPHTKLPTHRRTAD